MRSVAPGTRVPRTTTFFGRSRRESLIAVAVVPVGLAAIGLRDTTGLPPAYFGALNGLMLVCYALGEEYGWRGYLQQARAPIARWKRLLLIAALWYVWHPNFLRPGMSVGGHVMFFAGLLFGSWGLRRVSEISGSILFVAAAIWTILMRRGRKAAPAAP